MLFSELYGGYFHAVAAVLKEAVAGTLTDQRMTEIIRGKAFAESVLTIPANLKNSTWPLLCKDNTTPLLNVPTMPLTTLQKRWMKALLLDPRIALFEPRAEGLEAVPPLFYPDTFVYFDQYNDGDPYEDAEYIDHFHTTLRALREHRKLKVWFRGHTGVRHSAECFPYRMEYSEKDDKFRLLTVGNRRCGVINMARLDSCELLEPYDPDLLHLPRRKTEALVLLLRDERNALERALLHFSHFEKETVRLEDRQYRITLRYEREDETELLIRVLSFGPMVQVISPDRFIALIRERLNRQESCEL
ncbi:hypothetical protein OBV_05080 [Oscillibacter valericigenes Sjm18-20]|nr:hypothetical protein OBV_05080 [Oscillibacter valericigenes Sjm18-20]